jgi:glycosyltransferase involved in cell wall biosynthesis
MRILHIIPSLSQHSGGPPQVAMNLVKALRDEGVGAEIVTTNHDLPAPLDVPLQSRIEYAFSTNQTQMNASIPVWFLPYDPPALKEFIFSRALTGWLWNHISNYDILDNHYLFSYAPTCAAMIARRKKIPYTVRTMGQLAPWSLEQSRLKKQIYSFFLERHTLNHAAAIHCTTPAEAEDVKHFGIKTPQITLPLGVHTPPEYADAKTRIQELYKIKADIPIILFLSRLHYKKRPELLIEALFQLKERGKVFHLILAGSGTPEYIATLKEKICALQLENCVSLVGFTAGYEKDILLQGADLFVLPSYSENFGIAVAEALAAGLPVIVTPGVQISADIRDAKAGLVVENTLEDLTAALEQLLSSQALRLELGNNGYQLALNTYSWPAIAKQLIAAYEGILKQSACR